MDRNNIVKTIRLSLEKNSGVHELDELLQWIEQLNRDTYVKVEKADISKSGFWIYDDIRGEVLNLKRSFFSVYGLKQFINGEHICEQPIINQPEIGFLGIIAREFNGVLHFLMQAKIEPGNINCVQISPTIQATKSNFTRAHGGRFPEYFDIFENCSRYNIIYDQIQSEQGSRFFGKRNRNIIIETDEILPESNNFRWMTLGQIKKMMLIDNLVNMDTRTVLSGLDYYEYELSNVGSELSKLICGINDFKMFNAIKQVRVPLNELAGWVIEPDGKIYSDASSNFYVDYFAINIDGREVHKWEQPLLVSKGIGLFALLYQDSNQGRKYLVKIKSEVGILDSVEVAPSVQLEYTQIMEGTANVVDLYVLKHLEEGKSSQVDVILSEEGGRFYHEQNRNVIFEVIGGELEELPDEYYWVGYEALQILIKRSNVLNIQLRNLISLIQKY